MKNYGNGKSSEMEQTVFENIQSGFKKEDLKISDKEKEILKKLATEVAVIADSKEMISKRGLWKEHNELKKTRPVVFCDPENGWNEVITETQLECTSKIARRWEMNLRKDIFWGNEMGDDKTVDAFFNVPITVSPDDWGVEAVYEKSESQGAFNWESPIRDYKIDLPKVHPVEFEIDWEATKGSLALAEEIFGGIINVRQKATWWWSLGITYPAVVLRGMENMFLDFMMYPDDVKQLFAIISESHNKKLDFLEKNNLLSLNNDGTYIGSGGLGYTSQLPSSDYSGNVGCKDMWGFVESQETVSVSPEMYEEFIFPYEQSIMNRFGLNCYGCCEPLDARWHIVKRHSNLRRVSVSAWADLEKMSDNLSNDYIFSYKPNPAPIAVANPDWKTIRKELRLAMEIAKDNVMEVIMKDNHTIGGNPQNIVEWSKIAKEEALRVFNY